MNFHQESRWLRRRLVLFQSPSTLGFRSLISTGTTRQVVRLLLLELFLDIHLHDLFVLVCDTFEHYIYCDPWKDADLVFRKRVRWTRSQENTSCELIGIAE